MAKDYGRDYLDRVVNGTHDNPTPPTVGRAAGKAQDAANGFRMNGEWQDGPNAMADPSRPVKGRK